MSLLRKAPWAIIVFFVALGLATGCKPPEDPNGECQKSSKSGQNKDCTGTDTSTSTNTTTTTSTTTTTTTSTSTETDPGPGLPPMPGRICTFDHFKQNKEEQTVKKVDILFVMDHSGSMADDWARVAANVGNMVKELPADTDTRYAVLLANGATWKGKLYAPAKVPVVMSNQTMKVKDISSNLQKIFEAGMKVSDGNAQGEASFLSLYHAVTTSARENQNLGFFRPDAGLSVLFMSDEQEVGFPFPNPQAPGLPPRCDAAYEDNVKKVQYDQKGINLDLTFNALKALKGDMPVVTHAFVNITKEDLFTHNSKKDSCLYDSLGYGYFEAVAKTKGVLFSIQADKAEGMARCGRMIKERMQLIYDFPLSKPAAQVDPATILAAVDAKTSTHAYNAATNVVHLDNAGVHGSEIEIRHCEPIRRQEWTLQDFAGQTGQYSASLSWRTPEYGTNGKVVYGLQVNALNQEVVGQTNATNHGVNVSGLFPNTVYYFQAISRDEYAVEKRSNVISLRTKPDWQIAGVGAQASRATARINWRTSDYATQGKVLYGTSANALTQQSAETAAGNDHSVELTGLLPNTVYHFQCVSRDEYGLEKKSAVATVTTLSDWAILGFAGEVSRNTAALHWETPDYTTQGRLLWGTSAAGLTNQLSSGTGRTHAVNVTGLQANTLYYFQAVGLDNLGVEKRSAVISLRTITDWSLTAFAGTATKNSVSLSWKTLEYATNGKVFWGSTAETLSSQVVSAVEGNEHSVTINGLASDTLYYFQAASTDNLGVTKASTVVAIRTLPEPVVEPQLPVWEMTDFAGHADKTFVVLGWKTTDYSTTGRVLWGISETNLNHQVAETAAVRDHSLLVDGLTPDTIYYFQAISLDDFGQEKRSPVTAVRTLAEDPTDPPPVADWTIRGFDATTTATSADVIWQTRGAPTKATIKVGLDPSNLTLLSVPVDDYAETQLVPVTGLSPNTTYYLQVIAVDRAGRTQESVVIMKRTKAN